VTRIEGIPEAAAPPSLPPAEIKALLKKAYEIVRAGLPKKTQAALR
jgi:predicted DNA-binding protein (MmcQ/YjbR family)